MTEYTPNFISTYDNVLTSEECKQIIYEFEDSKEKQVEGKVGDNKIKIGTKKSTDITYNFLDNSLTTEIISKSCLAPIFNNSSGWFTLEYDISCKCTNTSSSPLTLKKHPKVL